MRFAQFAFRDEDSNVSSVKSSPKSPFHKPIVAKKRRVIADSDDDSDAHPLGSIDLTGEAGA